MNRTLVGFILILAILTFISYRCVVYVDNMMSPLEIYGNEDHKVESFKLTNQLNETFDSEKYKDKIWVVNYFFTSCPSVCPKMMRNLQRVHDRLKTDKEVLLLSFTVDPKRDNPERFMKFLSNYNIQHSSWQLLTGSKIDLYRLARKSFLISATDGGGDEYDFIHSENIVVLDKNKKIRAIINGLAEDADIEILNVISRIKRKE